MEGFTPVDNNSAVVKPGSRLRELGLVLPKPPTPLGAYVEASQVDSLLFLSGTLPIVNGKLAISGRLGANLSVEQGREAARLAALNALAAAQEHVGDLDRLKKLVKLSVLILATEEFVEHAICIFLRALLSGLTSLEILCALSTGSSASRSRGVLAGKRSAVQIRQTASSWVCCGLLSMLLWSALAPFMT